MSETKTEAECLATMVQRLARSLQPGYLRCSKHDSMDVATLLDTTEEEAGFMLLAGILGNKDTRFCTSAEMLAFLEAHGAAWFQVKHQQAVERMRDVVARLREAGADEAADAN